MTSKRKREYKIYATRRGGDFTTKSIAYSQGTHRWTYTVYATSIKQAYCLAGSEAFATDANSVGVRVLEVDWWHGHYGHHTPETAAAAGLRLVAPYRR